MTLTADFGRAVGRIARGLAVITSNLCQRRSRHHKQRQRVLVRPLGATVGVPVQVCNRKHFISIPDGGGPINAHKSPADCLRTCGGGAVDRGPVSVLVVAVETVNWGVETREALSTGGRRAILCPFSPLSRKSPCDLRNAAEMTGR